MEIKRNPKAWQPKKPTGTWSYDNRYHTQRWRNYRKYYLKRNPLCRICERQGLSMAATVIDHIIPVSEDSSNEMFWNQQNHQPLCETCHNRKTGTKK